MKKLVIKKSLFPDGNKTHVVISKSMTKYGICEGRVFKGSRDECIKFRQNQIQTSCISK